MCPFPRLSTEHPWQHWAVQRWKQNQANKKWYFNDEKADKWCGEVALSVCPFGKFRRQRSILTSFVLQAKAPTHVVVTSLVLNRRSTLGLRSRMICRWLFSEEQKNFPSLFIAMLRRHCRRRESFQFNFNRFWQCCSCANSQSKVKSLWLLQSQFSLAVHFTRKLQESFSIKEFQSQLTLQTNTADTLPQTYDYIIQLLPTTRKPVEVG